MTLELRDITLGKIENDILSNIYTGKLEKIAKDIGFLAIEQDGASNMASDIILFFKNNDIDGLDLLNSIYKYKDYGSYESDYALNADQIEYNLKLIITPLNLKIENDKIMPFFEDSDELISEAEDKLKNKGFPDIAKKYVNAYNIYHQNDSGTIGELRNIIEDLINHILINKGIQPLGNHKDNLIKFRTQFNVFKKNPINSNDYDVEDAYSIYSILSEYGSHPNQVRDITLKYLFLKSTIYIIYITELYENEIN